MRWNATWKKWHYDPLSDFRVRGACMRNQITSYLFSICTIIWFTWILQFQKAHIFLSSIDEISCESIGIEHFRVQWYVHLEWSFWVLFLSKTITKSECLVWIHFSVVLILIWENCLFWSNFWNVTCSLCWAWMQHSLGVEREERRPNAHEHCKCKTDYVFNKRI